MKKEALRLVERFQFAVIPVQPSGKQPLIRRWQELATTDPNTISDWWTRFPDANVGVATGARSNVFVLDVDGPAGIESLEELRAAPDWPETLKAKTGSGGFHFYFRWDPSRPLRNSARQLGPGLDIRGEGGFVVAPPSIHPNGNRYEWVNV